MALTPEDVRNKQFSTAKRKGYEMDEVDSFLDTVEAELARLAGENAALQGRVAAAEQSAAAATAAAAAAPPPPPPAPPAPDHNEQAVAMLALAQKTADEHKSRAKAEADALLAGAHAKVAELERAGAAERAGLERRVEELRAFEREYRSRLRQHHEAALRELDTRGTDAATAPAAGGIGAPVAAAAAVAPVPTLAPAQPSAPPAAPAPHVAAPAPAPSAPQAPPAPQPPAPPQSAPQPPAAPPQGAPSTLAPPPPASPFAVPDDEAPPQQA
jgi:DivIVA domain-containing protein